MGVEKYYTPTIEEFHVGFECELRNSSGEVYEWEPFEIVGVDDAKISGYLMDWSFYDSRNAIEDKYIRVKYLDKEDIESLGWKQSGLDKEKFSINWIDNPAEDNNAIWLTFRHHVHIVDCRGFLHMPLFLGIIKNKSELKKLMQQLGI